MHIISVEAIGAVFSGLVLVIGALATFTANRSRRVGEDRKALKRQYRNLQRKFLAGVQHIFKLETELAERGIHVPPRPAILEADDDDDDSVAPTPAPPPPPVVGGQHG